MRVAAFPQKACYSIMSHVRRHPPNCNMAIFLGISTQPSGPPWAVSHAGAMDGSELQLVEVPGELRKASVESGNGASTEKKFLTRCGRRAKRSTHEFSPEKYGLPPQTGKRNMTGIAHVRICGCWKSLGFLWGYLT